MRVSAKADYAIRAALELAAADGSPLKGYELAEAQAIPKGFLENILLDLRHADIVGSQRGSEGGYWLTRPAEQVTVADVFRAVEGRITSVRGQAPEALSFASVAYPLEQVWLAVEASLSRVLDGVSLAELVRDEVPSEIRALAHVPST